MCLLFKNWCFYNLQETVCAFPTQWMVHTGVVGEQVKELAGNPHLITSVKFFS